MIVKSILLFLLLIVQYQIINKLFTLVDETQVEKWGSLITNVLVLSLFTYKYLQSFDLFSKIERFSIIGAVFVTILVLWAYNYVSQFRNLFVSDLEPVVQVTPEYEEIYYEQAEAEAEEEIEEEVTKPSYLKDFVGFGPGKHLKADNPIEERPYLDYDKEFSKYYHKNRYNDVFDYRFNNLYYGPGEHYDSPGYPGEHHSIYVTNYENDIVDSNKYKVRTDTKHIPEKMDHLITM
jgi:hypothetical protein